MEVDVHLTARVQALAACGPTAALDSGGCIPHTCIACHVLDCTDTNGIINLQTKEINSLETATLLTLVAVAIFSHFPAV